MSPSPSPSPSENTRFLPVADARLQYDPNNGYCGEVSIQTILLNFGAWIPQEVARDAGGGELLPGVNYEVALSNLGIRYEAFSGKGYAAFATWAMDQLRRGRGVITVAYLEGSRDADYDHVMPIMGSSPTSFHVATGYSTVLVQREVAGYSCGRRAKQPLERAGCVPSDTQWGYAITGLAAGDPRAELRVPSSKEPGLGKTRVWDAQLTCTGTSPGATYAVQQSLGVGQPFLQIERFVASGPSKTVPVTFQSGTPAYFRCVAA